jgi:hypothetical protein
VIRFEPSRHDSISKENNFKVGLPCLPTISATCSELGTGTHSVMLALLRFDEPPLPPCTDALETGPSAAVGPILPDDDDADEEGEHAETERPRTGEVDAVPSASPDDIADDVRLRFAVAKFTSSCRANWDDVPPLECLGLMAQPGAVAASWLWW